MFTSEIPIRKCPLESVCDGKVKVQMQVSFLDMEVRTTICQSLNPADLK
jgi:hypothetical protein